MAWANRQKCEQWLLGNYLLKVDINGNWKGGAETDHGRSSHESIQKFLIDTGCPRNVAIHIATVLGAHHGRIKFRPEPRGIKPPFIAPLSEECSGIDWQAERLQCASRIWEYFGIKEASYGLTGDASAIWWLAGLIAVAGLDWLRRALLSTSRQRRYCPATQNKLPFCQLLPLRQPLPFPAPAWMATVVHASIVYTILYKNEPHGLYANV